MDFELSDDQAALQDAVASLCAGRFDIETVRGMQHGLDRGRWSELADTTAGSGWAGPTPSWCSNSSAGSWSRGP